MELRRSSRLRAKTKPVTPLLLTRNRGRKYHIESHEEKENEEYEEMLKYKFIARPPPNFTFQEEQVGVPKRETRKTTKAKTPMALKRTQRSRISKAKNKKPKNTLKMLKALPLPDLKQVFEVAKIDCKTTKPAPFSFETKYQHPNDVKAKLMTEVLEKEKKDREFIAKPLYESTGFTVDKSMSKSCTQIKPFKLSKPDFHDNKLKRQVERVEAENLDLQKKRDFKAKYPSVLFDEPFVPEKYSQFSKPDEFDLHSEKRGVERKKFDIELEEQRLQDECQKAAYEKDQEILEKKEVTKLRKKLVHRANTIGEYKKQEYDDI